MSNQGILPVSEEELKRNFTYSRLTNENKREHVFEIGLALGGTVSSGAYTAGVLDFLIEALDAWEAERGKPGVPKHRVRISVISGTSGGGVCAIIAAKALSRRFDPQIGPAAPGTTSENPFYKVWVELADSERMLKNSDLAKPEDQVRSLLNGEFINVAAQTIVNWQGYGDFTREYVDHPLPVNVTLTNLRGVPFKQVYTGAINRPSYFVQHGDYVRILADTRSGTTALRPGTMLGGLKVPPDAITVSAVPNGLDWTHRWDDVAEFARGTSAFPFGLPIVKLARPMHHYRWRWVRSSDEYGQVKIVPLEVEWDLMRASPAVPLKGRDIYEFHSADGGAINNLPVELSRTWLSGIEAHNPRDADKACRAVIVVDPFTDVPDCGPRETPSLAGLPLRLMRSLVANNRFQTADSAYFLPKESFSRFMITPTRVVVVKRGGRPVKETKDGALALATAGFDAFIGFFERKFREHDYQIGRLNCQKFLYDRFVLNPTNDIFVEKGQDATPFVRGDMRPIIHLVDALTPIVPPSDAITDEPFPEWPRGALDPDRLRPALDARLGAILRSTAAHLQTGSKPNSSWWQFVLRKTAHWLLGPWAINGLIDQMKQDLRRWDLL